VEVVKILNKMNLNYLFGASLIQASKANLILLQKIEPYVTYGIPTRKTISNLVYKRGYGKVNNKRVPLSSNQVVEQALGEQGFICIEDLVHELATSGEKFDVVKKFIKGFKLNEPKGGITKKNEPFHAGGDWGNREEKINDLVEKMI